MELLRHELLAAIGNDEPITLVATAPLTNIALLLRAHPEVAAGIERLVFMGGSASVGNVTAVAEFNVFHDPEAAAITLAAARDLDIPVTMYGLDVFEQVRVDLDDAAMLRSRLDPACQLAGALIVARAQGREHGHHRRRRHRPGGRRPERPRHRAASGVGWNSATATPAARPSSTAGRWPDQIAAQPPAHHRHHGGRRGVTSTPAATRSCGCRR